MRFVERAVTSPGHCAVFPHMGGDHREGYLDTGSELKNGGDGRWDQHVYVSVVAVREMAAMVGMVDPADLVAELAAVRAANVELEVELAEADRRLEAVDIMESAGFTARKKAGRPPKSRDEIAA